MRKIWQPLAKIPAKTSSHGPLTRERSALTIRQQTAVPREKYFHSLNGSLFGNAPEDFSSWLDWFVNLTLQRAARGDAITSSVTQMVKLNY